MIEKIVTRTFVGIFPLMFAFAAGTANAADWEVLNTAPEEAMLLDKNSIHFDGSVWKAWAVETYMETRYLGEPVYPHRSRVTLYEFNCANGQLGYSAWSFQSGELGGGTTVWADTARSVAYFPPDPASSEAALLTRVCGVALARGGSRLVSDSRPYAAQE